MNSKGSHRSPNLFVVKGPEAPKKITGVEELSAEELDLVRHYQNISHSEGVLVGVVHGKAPWDLRPLLLNQGKIRIVRFSDPSLASYPELEGHFAALLRVLEVEKNLMAPVSVGRVAEQYWVRRLFFDQTLADLMEEGPRDKIAQRDVFVRSLILEVAHMHRVGLPHGHIAASNVAIVQQYPCIFDNGFLSATPTYSTSDSAPEIQAGAFASQASDIYGLGLLLRRFLPQPFSEHISGFLDRMTAHDPNMRPAIDEVRYFFDGPLVSRPAYGKQELLSGSRGMQVPSAGVILQEPAPSRVAAAESAPAAASKSGVSPVLYLMLAGLVLLAVFQYRNYFSGSGEMQLKYQEYWSSGQPSLMRVVGEAAVEKDDRFAQAVIIRSAISGDLKVLSDLFRVAFDPRWEEQLSVKDRKFVLGIGLEKLLQYRMKEMPPLESLNPGVVLAMVSVLNLESEGNQFKSVPVQKMTELPDPIGSAFKNLAAQGIENMEEFPVRSLSHIIAGDVTNLSMAGYFKGCNEMSLCLMRLLSLRPFAASIRDFDLVLFSKLSLVAPQLQPLLDWFSREEIAQWSSAKPSVKLSLLTGQLPKEALPFEQIADLLRFPLAAIRQAAMERLIIEYGFGAEMQPFLEVLSTPVKDQMLTRAQSISLISSMLTKGDKAYSYLEQWFSTHPNPQIVLRLLIARGRANANDPFSLEACWYLSRVEWPASLSDLEILAQHKESLARALAYNRLRIDVPEELRILQQVADKETNARNRELIKQRLQAGEVFSNRP